MKLYSKNLWVQEHVEAHKASRDAYSIRVYVDEQKKLNEMVIASSSDHKLIAKNQRKI